MDISKYIPILESIEEKYNISIKDKDNAIDVIEVLRVNDLKKDMIKIYPEILNIKASKIENVVSAFNASNLDIAILEKNPIILEKTNATRVKKIATFLKDNDYNYKILFQFPEIIAVGKEDTMKSIHEFFKKEVGVKYLTNNGDILAYGNFEDVKEIYKELEKKDLLKIVLRKNPEVFYSNSASAVKDIIKLYESEKSVLGLPILKKYPEILSKTTKVRIVAIINLLERHGIDSKILKIIPKVVYLNDTKEIDNIISELKNRGISKEQFQNVAEILEINSKEKLDEIFKLADYLLAKEKEYGKILQEIPEILLREDKEEIYKIFDAIEKNEIDKDILKYTKGVLCSSTLGSIKEILKNLERINLATYYKEHPQILDIENPKNILDIYNTLIANDLDVSILNNVNVFLNMNSQRMQEICEAIEKNNLSKKILDSEILLNVSDDFSNLNELIQKKEKSKKQQTEAKEKEKEKIIIKEKEEKAKEDKEDRSEEKIKEFLKDKNLLNNPEVDIPSSVFSNVSVKNMTRIYDFFKELDLIEKLKSSITLLTRPYETIEHNFDRLLEYNMASQFLGNLSILGVNEDTIERRLKFLKSKLIEPTIQMLKMPVSIFNKEFSTTNEEMDEVFSGYIAQDLIDSPLCKYLEKDELNFGIQEKKAIDKIKDIILSLGVVKYKYEYIKCGYRYSLVKIMRNLRRLVTNLAQEKDITTINLKEIKYIVILSVLGNKVVTEEEAEVVCRSLITSEKEKDVYKEKEITKIEIDNSILYEEQIPDEINMLEDAMLKKQKELEKIEDLEKELEKLRIETLKDEKNEKVEIEKDSKDQEDHEKEKILKEILEMDIDQDQEEIEAEEKEKQNKLEELDIKGYSDIEKYILEKEKLEKQDQEEDEEKQHQEEREIEEKKEPEEIKEVEEVEEVEQENDKSDEVLENIEDKSEEEKQQVEEEESQEISQNQKKKIVLDEIEENEKQHISINYVDRLDKMKQALQEFSKLNVQRQLEEEQRIKREELQRQAIIEKRRQEKEIQELKKKKEELQMQIQIQQKADELAKEKIKMMQEAYMMQIEAQKNAQIEEQENIRSILEQKQEELKQEKERIQKEKEELEQEKLRLEEEKKAQIEIENLKKKEQEEKEELEQENLKKKEQEEKEEQERIQREKEELEEKKKIEIKAKKEELEDDEEEYEEDEYSEYDDIDDLINEYNDKKAQKRESKKSIVEDQMSDEKKRAIDAYYNNSKSYFDLSDFGYIANIDDEESAKELQYKINSLYTKNKRDYYDEEE